jgi:hypothetical protein
MKATVQALLRKYVYEDSFNYHMHSDGIYIGVKHWWCVLVNETLPKRVGGWVDEVRISVDQWSYTK